jgi:hypothetical protein
MEKFFYLVVGILSLGVFNLKAQVNVGSLDDPHSAAVLDLSHVSAENLGLLLPHVPLEDVSIFQLPELGITTSANAEGMMVFNTKTDTKDGYGKGVYVWYDNKWYPVSNTTSGGGGTTEPEPEPAPCSGTDHTILNGAYEVVNPAVPFTLLTADGSADVVRQSTYFKQKGNLCIQARAETGAESGIPWSSAANACTGDWRLPNLAELATINKQGEGVFTTYKMRASRRYWSSTITSKQYHWYFIFDAQSIPNSGTAFDHNDTLDANVVNTYVRCVRTGS